MTTAPDLVFLFDRFAFCEGHEGQTRFPITDNPAQAAFGHPGYDFVSVIAAIHHMDFHSAIERLQGSLTPGGVLVILGVAREGCLAEYAPALCASQCMA